MSREAGRGQFHQLGCGAQVPVRPGRVHVPEVGRQHHHLPVDVDPASIPVQQRLDGKAVSEVMHARLHRCCPQPESGGELHEGLQNAGVGQCSAGAGDEEGRGCLGESGLVPAGRVGTQTRRRALVQWDEAFPVELRITDPQHAAGEVDVITGQVQRFTDPHPGYGEQAQQRLVRGRPQRWGEFPGRGQEPSDVGWRPHVGRRAWVTGRPNSGGRHLRGRVDRLQVLREAPGRSQPVSQRDRLHALRQTRPGDRQVRRDRGGACCGQVGDQLRQHVAFDPEFEPQRSTEPQVVRNVPGEVGHHRPLSVWFGQGFARPRSAVRSTRA